MQHISIPNFLVNAVLIHFMSLQRKMKICLTVKCNCFQGMWVGVLHHVVNEHEWFLPYSEMGISACAHDPLSDTTGDKVWMTKGSPAHEALRKVILDKRFLNNIHYYLNFRYELKNYIIEILIVLLLS